MSSRNLHPWFDGRFTEVDTLLIHERIWTFMAAHCASGDIDGLVADWHCLADEHQLGGIEAILQTHLFAGYPRTINALVAVQEHGALILEGFEEFAQSGFIAWREQGEKLCRQIYGQAYPKLRTKMASLHPDLDRWMLEVGYGRVLSRSGMTPRQRELAVIAVLAGQNVLPQLRSHLRGALNVGATMHECASVLEQTDVVWGKEAQRQVDCVWRAFKFESGL